MYIINGIAYANNNTTEIEIESVTPLEDMMMIITFTSGEKRLYDATILLNYPAFKPLADEKIFNMVKVDDGIVTWCDGEIDIAPETMYCNSYAYSEIAV